MPTSTATANIDEDSGEQEQTDAGAGGGVDSAATVHTVVIYVPDVWHAQPTGEQFDTVRARLAAELRARHDTLDVHTQTVRDADSQQLAASVAAVAAAEKSVVDAETLVEQVPTAAHLRVCGRAAAAARPCASSGGCARVHLSHNCLRELSIYDCMPFPLSIWRVVMLTMCK
jgi:hypothetical protein